MNVQDNKRRFDSGDHDGNDNCVCDTGLPGGGFARKKEGILVAGRTRVLANEQVAPGIMRLSLQAPELAKTAGPGQFINLYLDAADMLLPRPFGISDVQGDALSIVYGIVGKGTEWLARVPAGSGLRILGPQGNGFDLTAAARLSAATAPYTGAPGVCMEVDQHPGSSDICAESGEHRKSFSGGDDAIADQYRESSSTCAESDKHRKSFSGGDSAIADQHAGPMAPGSVWLVGGGLGIPPLRFAARKLRAAGVAQIHAFLGFKDRPWFVDEMKAFAHKVYTISETGVSNALDQRTAQGCFQSADHSQSNDGETVFPVSGNVLDLIRIKCVDACTGSEAEKPLVLACGPQPMLKALSVYCAERAIPAQISLEARMGCGFGACVGCTIAVKGEAEKDAERKNAQQALNRKKVCVDGPVFWSNELCWA